MTDWLDDRIRSLMVEIVEASPTAQELEENMELRLSTEPDAAVVPLQPQPAEPPRRRQFALASAAAVLLAVVGAALLLRTAGSDTLVVTSPADPSSLFTWSRVANDEVFSADFSQGMNSVTAGGPGLVAVGQAEDAGPGEDAEWNAAVWTSLDGTTWSRVPHDEAVFGTSFTGRVGLRRVEMTSVTVGGPGLVAVGSDYGAAVWTSVDGTTWSRVPHDEAVFGASVFGDVHMTSVTVGGPGLVAVGFDGEGQGLRSHAVVWTSTDGVTWSRVPHDDAIFGGGWMAMHSVTVGGPGLIAVGFDWRDEDAGGSAVVWTSTDGIDWSRVPHSEDIFGGAAMNSVTVGGPGLVAVGFAEVAKDHSVAAVWTSVDGTTWSRVPHNEAVFGGEDDPPGWTPQMSSVIAGGPGLVAVGSDFMRSANSATDRWVVVAAAWTSVDGVDWSRVPHDEAVFAAPPKPNLSMTSITVGGPGLVAVGANTVHGFWANHDDSGEADAVVWIAAQGE